MESLMGLTSLPCLQEKGHNRREFLYYTSNVQAFRQGKYKIRKVGKNIELYDLEADIGETKNLAAKQPDRAENMLAQMKKMDKQIEAGMRPIGTLKE